MKNILVLTITFLPFVCFAQTKAVVPKDLQPSQSVSMKSVDGSMVIGLKDDKYPNGQMISSGAYTADNKKDGLWYFFREDGSVELIVTYVRDEPDGKSEWYNTENILIEQGYYTLGVKTGTWDTFHANGKVKMTGKYVDGLRDGAWEVNYESGNASSRVSFKAGNKEGTEKQYYDSGKVQGELIWKAGVMHGQYTEYFENGKVKVEGVLTDGKQTGNWKVYDETGAVTQEYDY